MIDASTTVRSEVKIMPSLQYTALRIRPLIRIGKGLARRRWKKEWSSKFGFVWLTTHWQPNSMYY
jgi:hypothetical protein